MEHSFFDGMKSCFDFYVQFSAKRQDDSFLDIIKDRIFVGSVITATVKFSI